MNAADPLIVQDHLTLKNERVAKIMKVTTINPAITLCAALHLRWSIGAPSRAARQEKYEQVPTQVPTRYSRHKTVAATFEGCQLLKAQRHGRRPRSARERRLQWRLIWFDVNRHFRLRRRMSGFGKAGKFRGKANIPG